MIEVVRPGLYTTVQDYPGRIGYWHVGIPPSGPMDPLAFRLANILVGNEVGAPGLEITASGPKLRFTRDAVVALAGAPLKATLDGTEAPLWESFLARTGSVLVLGSTLGKGARVYMAVRGGIDVPAYLGSRSTFPYGGFGGYQGRPLQAGDALPVRDAMGDADAHVGQRLVPGLVPSYANSWDIAVLPGPHEAPDFFTTDDVEVFYRTGWVVHHNSNRLGYRLIGPKLQFARPDGGEGGHHPSNIHDCPYAIGTINFTGDVPIVITADGPSLGGFVSIATVISAELWKVGQARASDVLRFRRVTLEQALDSRREQEDVLARLAAEMAR